MRLFNKTGLTILPLPLLLFLTPSLIHRSWFVQGVLGGLSHGLGLLDCACLRRALVVAGTAHI